MTVNRQAVSQLTAKDRQISRNIFTFLCLDGSMMGQTICLERPLAMS